MHTPSPTTLSVRLVTEHRRGSKILSPGVLVTVPAAEAQHLIEQGVAVPAHAEVWVEKRVVQPVTGGHERLVAQPADPY